MPISDTVLSSTWLEARQARLRSVIAKKLGADDAHVVDDVWQELHLAVEKQNGSKSVKDPDAWVRQVINHKVADYLRCKQRSQRLESRILETVESPVCPTPFDWVLELEDRQQVRDALARCTPENRKILRLKYFSEASGAEIASALNISPRAAEYQLHRAREQFRQFINQSRNKL
jgi:RNA polymerase sigma factor (sigma-70 family)